MRQDALMDWHDPSLIDVILALFHKRDLHFERSFFYIRLPRRVRFVSSCFDEALSGETSDACFIYKSSGGLYSETGSTP